MNFRWVYVVHSKYYRRTEITRTPVATRKNGDNIPMSKFNAHRQIVYLELLGFIAILSMTWIGEGMVIRFNWLQNWLGTGDWNDAVLETLVIVMVALPVMILSARLSKRLYYLESFLRICAWCRKIDMHGNWVSLEEYFSKTSDIEFSHGICQNCARELTQTGQESLTTLNRLKIVEQ